MAGNYLIKMELDRKARLGQKAQRKPLKLGKKARVKVETKLPGVYDVKAYLPPGFSNPRNNAPTNVLPHPPPYRAT